MQRNLTKDEKREQKLHVILSNAAKEFIERGYYKTSLDDIARMQNVTKPTLYYYIKNKEDIQLRKYINRIKKSAQERKVKSDDVGTSLDEKGYNSHNLNKIKSEKEKRLFETLKAKRLELAKNNNVPPYVIFHDNSLIEMAKIVPQSLDALSLITGVGNFKLNKYGSIFLDILIEN